MSTPSVGEIDRHAAGRLHRVGVQRQRRARARVPPRSPTGCMTPVSLLASCSASRTRPAPCAAMRQRVTARSASDRRRRRGRRGSSTTFAPEARGGRQHRSRARCRPARSRPSRRRRTMLLASVAPLVNTTSVGLAPTSAATSSRAVSTMRAGAAALGMHRGRIAGRRRAPRASPRAPRAAAAPSRSSRDMCARGVIRAAPSSAAGERWHARRACLRGRDAVDHVLQRHARQERRRSGRRARPTDRASGSAGPARHGVAVLAVAARHARVLLDRRHDLGDVMISAAGRASR